MRVLWALVMVSAACLSAADREITVPKGNKLRDRMFRAEILGVPGENSTHTWFGTGFLKAYDFEYTMTQKGAKDWESSFDLSYNFFPPITDISPGISVGVQDALNVTAEGRALYLATTFRYGNIGDLNQDVPTEFTVGFWSRKSGLAFFAVRLPLSNKVFLIGEHDSQRLVGGVEIRPFTGLVLKTVFEEGATSFGLALAKKF